MNTIGLIGFPWSGSRDDHNIGGGARFQLREMIERNLYNQKMPVEWQPGMKVEKLLMIEMGDRYQGLVDESIRDVTPTRIFMMLEPLPTADNSCPILEGIAHRLRRVLDIFRPILIINTLHRCWDKHWEKLGLGEYKSRMIYQMPFFDPFYHQVVVQSNSKSIDLVHIGRDTQSRRAFREKLGIPIHNVDRACWGAPKRNLLLDTKAGIYISSSPSVHCSTIRMVDWLSFGVLPVIPRLPKNSAMYGWGLSEYTDHRDAAEHINTILANPTLRKAYAERGVEQVREHCQIVNLTQILEA